MRIRFAVATLVVSTIVTLASAQTVRWKVVPEYNSITCISPSLLLAERNGLYGLLGTDGRLKASCEYDIITPVVEDRCLLLSVNGRLQAISDASGNAVKQFGPKEDWYVDTEYPYYSEGLLAVCNKRGKWTYMDKTGLTITNNPEFKGAAPFLNGYAVVRYKDNSYMHINKRGAISKLDNQFKDNYLSFASSFTPERGNNGEALVAVIVDSGNNVFLRDRSGKKVGNLGNVTDWDKFDRKMTTNQFVILFEANRQIRSITPQNKGVSKTYSPQTVEPYRPPVFALTSGESDGKYSLLYEGRELLPARFDNPPTILSATEIIAGQNGYFGILVIDNGYSPRLEMSQTDFTFEHHKPATVSATINVDPDVEEGKYHIVVSNKENILFDGSPKSGSVSFDYLPEDLSENGTEYFDVSTDIDGIAHPVYSFPLSISYKSRFTVKLPGRVRLNEANTVGKVTLTISNEAASESDLCDILVNGNTVRKGVRFQSNESFSIPISESVDIQDLDNVSSNFSIQVKETGCPVYKVTRKVIFERNL